MERRHLLVLTLGVLTAVSGCQTPLLRLPVFPFTSAKDKEEVRHKPETYVKFGDFRANSAAAPEFPPAQARQLREEARLSYQKALDIDPDYRPAHLALARLYQTLEDYPRAIAEFRKALQLDDKDGPLWFELGLCQARHREWDGALESMRQASDHDQNNRQYTNALGFTLGQVGRHQEALEVFGRVNSPGRSHYNLARLLQYNNQLDLSRQHLQTALSLEPQLAEAQVLLASLSGPTAAAAPVQTALYKEMAGGAPGRPAAPAPAAPAPAAPAPPAAGSPIPVPPLPFISIRTKE
jgi:tetratricopeptide (TPR) repeat protein